MLRHFRPLFVTNALEAGNIAALAVDLVEVNARAADVTRTPPDQPPPLQMEDSCRLVSCQEEGGVAELLVRASLGGQAEAAFRFKITVVASNATEARLLEHPRSLGVIASIARPAVLDTCRMVMSQLVQRRRLQRAPRGPRRRMRPRVGRQRVAGTAGGEAR